MSRWWCALVVCAGCSFAIIRPTASRDHGCGGAAILADLPVPALTAIFVTRRALEEADCRGSENCGHLATSLGIPAVILALPFLASAVYGGVTLSRCFRDLDRRDAARTSDLVAALAITPTPCGTLRWLAPEIYRRDPPGFEASFGSDAGLLRCTPALTTERIQNLRATAHEAARANDCARARTIRGEIYALQSAARLEVVVPDSELERCVLAPSAQ